MTYYPLILISLFAFGLASPRAQAAWAAWPGDPFASSVSVADFAAAGEHVLVLPVLSEAMGVGGQNLSSFTSAIIGKTANGFHLSNESTLGDLCHFLGVERAQCLSLFLRMNRRPPSLTRSDYQGALKLRHQLLMQLPAQALQQILDHYFASRSFELGEVYLAFHPDWFRSERIELVLESARRRNVRVQPFCTLHRAAYFALDEGRSRRALAEARDVLYSGRARGLALSYTNAAIEQSLSDRHSLSLLERRWTQAMDLVAQTNTPLWLNGLDTHPSANFLMEALEQAVSLSSTLSLILSSESRLPASLLQQLSTKLAAPGSYLAWDRNYFGSLSSLRVVSQDWELEWATFAERHQLPWIDSRDLEGMRSDCQGTVLDAE